MVGVLARVLLWFCRVLAGPGWGAGHGFVGVLWGVWLGFVWGVGQGFPGVLWGGGGEGGVAMVSTVITWRW